MNNALILGNNRIGRSLKSTLQSLECDVHIVDPGNLDELPVDKKFDWIFVATGPSGGGRKCANFAKSLSDLIGLGNIVICGAESFDVANTVSETYNIDVVSMPDRPSEKNAPKIIGDVNGTLATKLAELFKPLPTIVVNSSTVADICKITGTALAYLITGFTIELQKVCEVTGVDPAEVIRACNIGRVQNVITAKGLGVYGAEPRKYSKLFSNFAYSGGIIESAIRINDEPLNRIAYRINGVYQRVGVIGLSFKGAQSDDEDQLSPFSFLQKLCPTIEFETWDPVIAGTCNTINDVFTGADAVVILTPCITKDDIPRNIAENVEIFDPYGVHE